MRLRIADWGWRIGRAGLLIGFFAVLPWGLPLRAQQQGVRLDFQDVELRLVLAALADAGNLNLVYGDLPASANAARTSRSSTSWKSRRTPCC